MIFLRSMDISLSIVDPVVSERDVAGQGMGGEGNNKQSSVSAMIGVE